MNKNNNKKIIIKDFKRIETYQNLNFNKNILSSYDKKIYNNNINSIITNSYNKNFKIYFQKIFFQNFKDF